MYTVIIFCIGNDCLYYLQVTSIRFKNLDVLVFRINSSFVYIQYITRVQYNIYR